MSIIKRKIDLNVENTTLETSKFKSFDYKHDLVFHCWKPVNEDKEKPILVLVHGMGDHSGHFLTMVEEYCAKQGYTIYGYDQRGHGESTGNRGQIKKWRQYEDDTTKFLELVREKENNKPMVLFGNSMGGCLVLGFVLKNKHEKLNVIGVAANGPALRMFDLPPSVVLLARMISSVSSASVSPKLESNKMTNDPEKIKENDEDELVHTTSSFALLAGLGKNGAYILQNASKFPQIPMFVVVGSEDPIVNSKQTVEFVKKVQQHNENASYYVLEGGKHETFNETPEERKKVFSEFTKFMSSLKH